MKITVGHILLAGLGLAAFGVWRNLPPQSPARSPAPAPAAAERPARALATAPSSQPAAARRDRRVVHVFVALCDNAHQGIVPVPAALGNGQDPQTNLYWGAQYGVQTFLRHSLHWQPVELAATAFPKHVLAQAVFRHTASDPAVLLFAQAFDGAYMKDALEQFLRAAAGQLNATFEIQQGGKRVVVPVGGASDLVCFVGHNGLMDMQLDEPPKYAGGNQPRSAVVLACQSRRYFLDPLKAAHCEPLLTTTGLMAPEAYTLEAAVRTWAAGRDSQAVREAAAQTYAEHQKCSLKAAQRLFATGW
jgi:hypothetical protein